MLTIHTLALGLSTVVGSLAAPTAGAAAAMVKERGGFNFIMGPDHPLMLAKRNASLENRQTNYVQDYTTGGDVEFTPSDGGFTLNFNTQEDFVVGVGWNPGSDAPITHSGNFAVSSGLGTLSVYGWTTDPLVEYYVIEDSSGFQQQGQQMGTVTSDGATYTIWENQRVNAPSIQGTTTFNQYISVRDSGTSSGTVTMANHFNAWQQAGLNLGTQNFQVIAVESWNGAGSAQQSVSQGSSGGQGPAGTASGPGNSTGGSNAGKAGSAAQACGARA